MLSLCLSVLAFAAAAEVRKAQVCSTSDGICANSVASETLLLQVGSRSSLSTVEVMRDNLMSRSCTGMQDVEKECSGNGCRVLATNMQGRSCQEYCARQGRACVGAAEEVEETCQVLQDMTCDQIWGQTSDLICECSESMQDGSCAGLSNVEKTCSDDGCKVLADHMQGRTCRQYCGNSGLMCVGAWEEENDDCNVKATLSCDDTWPHTSDLICQCATGAAPGPAPPAVAPPGNLVWSDEFNGGRLDLSKWTAVRKGGGFGNKELQVYTDHPGNMRVANGVLTITAKCEEYKGQHYSSSKLETKRKGDWGPGHRIEVRARLPKGKGTWPAIWMLPTDKAYGGWPKSGEIDIVETVGCSQNKVHGTVHTGAYNHMLHTQKAGDMHTEIGEWHTYSIEWTASEISWFVDGARYHHFKPSSHSNSDKWPFNRQFYLILNLAVGGTWGGWCVDNRPSCSSHDQFRHAQVMEVDYARVYAL